MCKCVSKRTSVNNTVLLLLLQGMVLDNLIGNSIIEAARGEYSEIQRVEYIIVSCARINVIITFFFWVSGFIRSFERVLRVQSRINIRFFLFSSLVSGASVLRSLVFHSQKKRTGYVSGVSTKYNKRDNRAYKTGNVGA